MEESVADAAPGAATGSVAGAATEAARRRGLLFVGLASACVGFALVLQMSLNNNFLVGEIHVSGFQAGALEAVRESCGIWAFGILALLAGFAEPVIAALVLVFVGLGLGAYSLAPTYGIVMLMSVVWSQGLHVWMPLPNSMALSLAEPGRAGARLGQVQAFGAAGSAIGLCLALALTLLGVPIRPLYVMAGAAALLAAASCLGIPRQVKTPAAAALVFNRKYATYYLLCFLEGWRKQIAVCFAGFLLVNRYHAAIPEMIVLWTLIQVIGWFLSPRVGRLIDRVGERRILTFYYILLTLFFVGYATIQSRYVLYAIFVLDSASFAFATALTTYVNRIAPKSDHTRVLSMGVAMNHVAAVSMPFIGGVLWSVLGYQWAFLIGIPAAAASIVTVLRLPGHGTAARQG